MADPTRPQNIPPWIGIKSPGQIAVEKATGKSYPVGAIDSAPSTSRSSSSSGSGSSSNKSSSSQSNVVQPMDVLTGNASPGSIGQPVPSKPIVSQPVKPISTLSGINYGQPYITNEPMSQIIYGQSQMIPEALRQRQEISSKYGFDVFTGQYLVSSAPLYFAEKKGLSQKLYNEASKIQTEYAPGTRFYKTDQGYRVEFPYSGAEYYGTYKGMLKNPMIALPAVFGYALHGGRSLADYPVIDIGLKGYAAATSRIFGKGAGDITYGAGKFVYGSVPTFGADVLLMPKETEQRLITYLHTTKGGSPYGKPTLEGLGGYVVSDPLVQMASMEAASTGIGAAWKGISRLRMGNVNIEFPKSAPKNVVDVSSVKNVNIYPTSKPNVFAWEMEGAIAEMKKPFKMGDIYAKGYAVRGKTGTFSIGRGEVEYQISSRYNPLVKTTQAKYFDVQGYSAGLRETPKVSYDFSESWAMLRSKQDMSLVSGFSKMYKGTLKSPFIEGMELRGASEISPVRVREPTGVMPGEFMDTVKNYKFDISTSDFRGVYASRTRTGLYKDWMKVNVLGKQMPTDLTFVKTSKPMKPLTYKNMVSDIEQVTVPRDVVESVTKGLYVNIPMTSDVISKVGSRLETGGTGLISRLFYQPASESISRTSLVSLPVVRPISRPSYMLDNVSEVIQRTTPTVIQRQGTAQVSDTQLRTLMRLPTITTMATPMTLYTPFVPRFPSIPRKWESPGVSGGGREMFGTRYKYREFKIPSLDRLFKGVGM